MSIPYSFSPNTTAQSSQVNTNFASILSGSAFDGLSNNLPFQNTKGVQFKSSTNALDSKIYEDSSNRLIMSAGNSELIRFSNDAESKYIDLDFTTTNPFFSSSASYIDFDNNVRLYDNKSLFLGIGNDLRLYHEPTGDNCQINSTKPLYIQNTKVDSNIYIRCNDGGVTRTAIKVNTANNAEIIIKQSLDSVESDMYLGTLGTIRCVLNNSHFRRGSAASGLDLGSSTYRWGVIYGTTGNFSSNMTIGGTLGVTGIGTINGTVIDSNEIDFNSSTFTLQNQGNTRVYYSNSETIQYNQFRPSTHKSYDLGTASNSWDDVYGDNFVNTCMWLDTEDDLALIDAIKPLKEKGKLVLKEGKPRIDYKSLPDFVKPHWKYKFRSKKEIKEKFGTEKAPEIDGYSIGNMLDLAVGAIRQLNKKVNDLQIELNKLK